MFVVEFPIQASLVNAIANCQIKIMSRGGVPGKKHTKKRQEVHVTLRAIIIYVRIFHPTLTFDDLEHQINVPKDTASAIFRTALAKSNCTNANCTDFHEILACCMPLTQEIRDLRVEFSE